MIADTEDNIEPMPKDVLKILMDMGLTEEQAEMAGFLGQKIRNYCLENIGKDDLVSPAELAIAATACRMTAAWFDYAAESSVDGTLH